MFYVTLESLELLQIASKYLTEKCLLGIEPNEEHMAKLAELSQANITLLSPEQGYEGAYKLSKISRENGRTSAQAVNQTNGQTNEPADVRTNPKFGADFKDKSKVKPNAKGELGEEE
jgi:fumarate hydratase class II